VYGIAASAIDRQAVSRLYRAKHREGKPGTVIAASVQQLVELGIPAEALAVVAHMWPAPLSVVLPCASELAYLDQGKNSLAVRIPADETLRKLLQQTGPLLTSSANQPGEPPATNLAMAETAFGQTVDFYVDGGVKEQAIPSTVIKLTNKGNIEVLRAGAATITAEEQS
jgi:tRNA threonylcarbamoyl adenosine modification protein (Sua5/YciO/YrdC/YwlC family)